MIFLSRTADVLDEYLQKAGVSIPSSEKEKKESGQADSPARIFGSDMVSLISMLAVVCQSACGADGYLSVWQTPEGDPIRKNQDKF